MLNLNLYGIVAYVVENILVFMVCLWLKYRKTRLHIDKEIYKRAQYSVQNLIAKKKKYFFENKLKCISKPKDEVAKINIQLNLSLIITKNFHYQKILNWTQ